MTDISDTLQSVRKTVGDSIAPVRREAVRWIEPFQRTEPQRDAARVLGRLGAGTFGFGGAAAALMMLRRKNERKLLDEEKAQALLEVPVFVDGREPEQNRKSAGMKTKAVAAGLGLLGLGSTAAGIAYSNGRTDGETSANTACADPSNGSEGSSRGLSPRYYRRRPPSPPSAFIFSL